MPAENNPVRLLAFCLLPFALLATACHHHQKGSGEKTGERVIPAYYKYFRGTAGGGEVTLQLIKYSERYEGTFEDDSTGQPLPLSGSWDSTGRLVLVTYNRYNAVDTLTGTFPQPGVFQGTMADTAGVHQPFTLQEIYPPGTCRWDVYTLDDSLALDSSRPDSPKARVQFMLLWPQKQGLSEVRRKLLEDSIVAGYTSLDSLPLDPAAILRGAEDTFFSQYRKAAQRFGGREGAMAATFNWQSQVRMSVLWNASAIVSLSFQTYSYTGGAHGLSNTSLMVFDLRTDKVLTMADLFKPGYEPMLQRVLERHLREAYDLPAGAPLNGNNGILFDKHLSLTRNFYLTGKGIGFIYNPYEVAPYVVGQIELYVPFAELVPVLKPGLWPPANP
jgi:hypothetical protein